jgi:RNA polymerase sigma-70 factor (ECF subfamily)
MPDTGAFARDTEPFRRELLAHCYRMLGSVDEAEDGVQEAYLRAWRAYDRFQARSSVRTWLYRIATNVCLTTLEQRGRRALPAGLGLSGGDPEAGQAAGATDASWIQPIPDALVTGPSDDPAAVVVSRQELRLALVASLQYLPARQRAVLLLREVLAFPSTDVAEMLGMSVAAVKSALQRARARLDEVAPSAEQIEEPAEPEARALLDRYVSAFESADAAALEQVLREDTVIEMTPSGQWLAGLAVCMPFLTTQALGEPGDWRMVPTSANGQPAAVAYRRGADGVHHAFGVAVLLVTANGIARITVFGDPRLAARFGLPLTG